MRPGRWKELNRQHFGLMYVNFGSLPAAASLKKFTMGCTFVLLIPIDRVQLQKAALGASGNVHFE